MIGPKGRWRNNLINKCLNAGVPLEESLNDFTIAPKIRQLLQVLRCCDFHSFVFLVQYLPEIVSDCFLAVWTITSRNVVSFKVYMCAHHRRHHHHHYQYNHHRCCYFLPICSGRVSISSVKSAHLSIYICVCRFMLSEWMNAHWLHTPFVFLSVCY